MASPDMQVKLIIVLTSEHAARALLIVRQMRMNCRVMTIEQYTAWKVDISFIMGIAAMKTFHVKIQLIT